MWAVFAKGEKRMEQLMLFDNRGNMFTKAGKALTKGDLWIKLSALLMLVAVALLVVGPTTFGLASTTWVWISAAVFGIGVGLCYACRKQFLKGLLFAAFMTVLVSVIYNWGIENVMKLNTLGTVEFAQEIDWTTGKQVVNDYDHSFKILLYALITLAVFAFVALLAVNAISSSYRLTLQKACGKRVNNFLQDLQSLLNEKFHLTLLSLPGAGILIFTVMPMLVLICIGFTNYDSKHLPPSKLFTWVGMENFGKLLGNISDSDFAYAFRNILVWTIIWAVAASVTCYFGGIVLAMLLNSKSTIFPKMWRTMFVLCIAVPQFASLMLIARFFGDSGIANTMATNAGITGVLQSLGWIKKDYIPFLSDPTVAKIMIIVINFWVGVPYQMLSATGILMNIPGDILESAKMDGASGWVRFWKITMPYYWSVTGPSFITSIVGNINNFNVIYLLTGTYTTLNMTLAKVNAKEMDLLITWLFSLTQGDAANYAMASVIGIVSFVICAGFTLFSLFYMQRGGRENAFG